MIKSRLFVFQVQTYEAVTAVKCSNQADPHLTFTDPIWPSDLPQRPSPTFLPLDTDQKVITGWRRWL